MPTLNASRCVSRRQQASRARPIANTTAAALLIALLAACGGGGGGGGGGNSGGGGGNGGGGGSSNKPVISRITPQKVMNGVPTGLVEIYGSNFTNDAQAELDGQPEMQTIYLSSTQVELQLNIDVDYVDGNHNITVVEKAGTSNAVPFDVYTPAVSTVPLQALQGFDPAWASSNLMVMADVNGDGRADAVMVGPSNNNVPSLTVMLGQANGQLGTPTVTPNLETGPMVAGDVDGNGSIDIVCVTQVQNNFEISVLMNDGDGHFTQGQQIPGGGIYTQNLNLVDMDGDGRPDLVFNVESEAQIYFAKNLGNGSFAAPVAIGPNTGGTGQMVVGDFTGDGKPDILYTYFDYNAQTSTVHLLTNQGGDQFVDASVPSIPINAQQITAGDFNNDGKLDVAVSTVQSGVLQVAAVQLYTGNGNGTFTAGSSTIIKPNPFAPFVLITGDFDGDGNLDLAGTNGETAPANLDILWGDGHGNFTAEQVNGPMGFFFCAAGDVNADGADDLIIPDRFGIISVALGSKTRTYPQIQSLVANNLGAPSVADINGDGLPDIYVAGQPGSVFLNQGNGQFTLGASPAGEGILVADLDGDGKPELIGTDNTNVLIWKGTGDPSYSGSPVTIAPPPGVIFNAGYGAVVVDVDGDGKPDIVTPTFVLFNQGNLQFTAVALPATASNSPYLVADFNHDGKIDVAEETNTFLYAGNRTFTTVTQNNLSFEDSDSWAVGDLNGDGYPDAVVATSAEPWLVVYFGNGDGTFYLQSTLNLGPPIDESFAMTIGDFNGDGHPDILACMFWDEQCALFGGDGKGAFTRTDFASGVSAAFVTAADLNGDGKPDLVIPFFSLESGPTPVSIILHK